MFSTDELLLIRDLCRLDRKLSEFLEGTYGIDYDRRREAVTALSAKTRTLLEPARKED